MSQAPQPAQDWLPQLCTLPRLVVMLGLAELVVLVLALSPDGAPHWTVEHFLSASAFALWQAIAVTALLCDASASVAPAAHPGAQPRA